MGGILGLDFSGLGKLELELLGTPLAIEAALAIAAKIWTCSLVRVLVTPEPVSILLVLADPGRQLQCGTLEVLETSKTTSRLIFDPRPYMDRQRAPTKFELGYYTEFCEEAICQLAEALYVDFSQYPPSMYE